MISTDRRKHVTWYFDGETPFIKPGSSTKNSDIESLNGNLRGDLWDQGIFDTLLEAKLLTEWRWWQYTQ